MPLWAVDNMVQIIESNDLFGKIGRGLGRGLSEQLPKEIEHRRLSEGLQKLSQQTDLDPMQFLTKAYSTYGITPQMVQSLGDAARFQNARNAFIGSNKRLDQQKQKNTSIPDQSNQNFSQSLQQIPFAGTISQRPNRDMSTSLEKENVHKEINRPNQKLINDKNPLRQEAQPIKPMTVEEKNADIRQRLLDNPYLTKNEARMESDLDEQIRQSGPEAERKADSLLEKIRSDLHSEFLNQLNTKLETNPKDSSSQGIYKDVTGVELERTKRLMEAELRKNPNSNINEVANDFSNRLVAMAEAKNRLKELASRDILDKLAPWKQKDNFNKLKEFQKTFAEAGNRKEFYNILRSPREKGGFEMSPMASSFVSYPISKNFQSYIDKRKNKPLEDSDRQARKDASFVLDNLTSNDSPASIAFALKFKDPNFNQRAYFDEISQNRDRLINDEQTRDLENGVSDVFPNWADLELLPFFRRP